MPEVPPVFSVATSSDAQPRRFGCDWKPDGFGSASVHLEGELDLSTLPTFRRALGEARQDTNIVSVDLRDLAFIDCAALGLLVEADAVARRSGSRLILVRGSGQVDRLLELTGVLERLEVVDLQLDKAPPRGARPSRRARVQPPRAISARMVPTSTRD